MRIVHIMLCLSFAITSFVRADLYEDNFGSYEPGSDGAPNWYTTSIGWEVRDGKYTASDPDRTFSFADKMPMGRSVTVKATITLRSITTDQWKTAGVVVYVDERNYWHFALVEQPDAADSGHFLELCEMQDGQWLAQTRLREVAATNMDFNWKYDHPYRIVLSLSDDRITGSISDLNGTLIAKRAYQLDEKSVNYGKPGLDNGGFVASFDDFKASVKEVVAVPKKKHIYPEYKQANCAEIMGEATGFFHLEKQNGIWWVIDPNGYGFYIVGTDHANYNVHWCEKLGYAPYHRNMVEKYGDNEDAWASNTASRLLKWGFNSLGANNSPSTRYRGLAHMEFAGVGAKFSSTDDIVPKVHWTGFPNVFNPKFEEYCDKSARERCAPNKDDAWLLGYFIDNELEWYGKSHTKWGLWEEAFKKPPEHTAKQALIGLLKERYKSIEDFNEAWEKSFQSFDKLAESLTPPSLPANEDRAQVASKDRQDFVRLVADRYFSITTAAIKKYDPNHMILGTRFAGNSPDVWDIAGKYCDIVSVNTYRRVDLDTGVIKGFADDLDRWHSEAGKPMMITEWSFPALDSGLPCTHGAGQRFDTQEQRAKAFSIFQEFLFRTPYMVGSDFFMWVDEPAEGISSTFPENTNYGLVDVNDKPYELLTKAATELNRKACQHHLRTISETKITPKPAPPLAEIPESKKPIDCEIRERSFRIDNGVMILEKTEAGGDMIDKMVVDGVNYGRFTPLIWQIIGGNQWARPDSIDKVELNTAQDCKTLNITASFSGDYAGNFRVKYQFSIYPGTRWIKAQLLQITNTDSKPWHLEGYFQYALSNTDNISKLESFPVVPNYYLPVGAWHDTELGTYFGVISVAENYDIRFWKDEDGNQHADALRRVRKKLRPGEVYDVPQPPIFIFAAGEDRASYLAILEQVRRCFSESSIATNETRIKGRMNTHE